MQKNDNSATCLDVPPAEHQGMLDCLQHLAEAFGTKLDENYVGSVCSRNKELDGTINVPKVADSLGFLAIEVDLLDVRKTVLPALVILEKGEPIVISGPFGSRCGVFDPKLGGGVRYVSAKKIKASSTSKIFSISHRMSPQTPSTDSVAGSTNRHWFWTPFRSNVRAYLTAGVGTATLNVLALVSTIYILSIYDRVIPNQAWGSMATLSVGFFVVIVFEFVLQYLRSHILDAVNCRLDHDIGVTVFGTLVSTPGLADQVSPGRLSQIATSYEVIRSFFSSATLTALGDLPFFGLFILTIYVVCGPQVAVWPAIGAVCILFWGLLLYFPSREAVRQTFEHSNERDTILFEALKNLSTITAVGGGTQMRERWRHSTLQLLLSGEKGKAIASILPNGAALINKLTLIAVVVAGFNAIVAQEMSEGALFAAVLLTSRALTPIERVAQLILAFHQAAIAYRAIDKGMCDCQQLRGRSQHIRMPSVEGRISFQNVSFKPYNATRPVLEDISLHIAAGEKVGILGPVGAGKSTLLKLIVDANRPTQGTVTIDGVIASHVDPDDLRQNVSFVPQETDLFSMSLRENIAIRPGAKSDSEIIEALEAAGVDDFSATEGPGLASELYDRGRFLSGGQRQAVALARALVGSPPIMVLDEPTSHYDTNSEQRFIGQMAENENIKTLILATHRRSLLNLVDRLIVLDKGRIVADGPRNSIIDALMHNERHGNRPKPEVA